MKLGRLI